MQFHVRLYMCFGKVHVHKDVQAGGWVLEFQPRQTQVIKTCSDSSTAKRSAIAVSVTGPRR